MTSVVFDLGGVVLTWDPPAIVASVFADPATRALVLERVFDDPDCVELDRGTLSVGEARQRAATRTGLDEPAIERLFDAMPRSLTPVPATVALIRELRAAGHHLYVLSNFQRESLAFVEAAYGILALFDGAVVSCEVGSCKPEPAIYRRLVDTFALEPAETVFIDDAQANLDAAAALGLTTVLFTTPQECRAALVALGCL